MQSSEKMPNLILKLGFGSYNRWQELTSSEDSY